MQRKISRYFPILIIGLGLTILYGRFLMTGQVIYWGLPALQFIPWRAYAWQQITMGILPFWNPLNGMGAPLLANYQLAIFYPPSWLLEMMDLLAGTPGMAWGFTLLVPIHLLWAGSGMVLLIRRMGMNEVSQFIGGAAFALSGFFTARTGFFSMIWAGAWLPWILLSLSAVIDPLATRNNRPWKFSAALVACLAMQLLAGHAQLTWYSLLLCGFWALLSGWNLERGKGVIKAGAFFAIHALIAA